MSIISLILTEKTTSNEYLSIDNKERFNNKTVLLHEQCYLIETWIHNCSFMYYFSHLLWANISRYKQDYLKLLLLKVRHTCVDIYLHTYIIIRKQYNQLKIRLRILLLTSFVPHNLYSTHQIKLPKVEITTLRWSI